MSVAMNIIAILCLSDHRFVFEAVKDAGATQDADLLSTTRLCCQQHGSRYLM